MSDASPAGIRFADILRGRDLLRPDTRVSRVSLHPADRSDDVPDLAALVRAGLLPAYERMQDGRRLGREALVASFAAEPGGRARLAGFRRVVARRPGIVPGDIVYDYDAAPLLHAFIARARHPVFYDAENEAGLEDLIGRLVVRWPRPLAASVRRAEEVALVVEGEPSVLPREEKEDACHPRPGTGRR